MSDKSSIVPEQLFFAVRFDRDVRKLLYLNDTLQNLQVLGAGVHLKYMPVFKQHLLFGIDRGYIDSQ